MSQNDFNIANQGFPATRADINSALQALASTSSGATEPGTIYAYQFWYDTSTNLLKMRNADNDAWITLAAFDQAADEWEVRTAVVQAVDSAGVVIKTDDGVARISVADSGAVSIGGNLAVDTNTLFVDAANNRVGVGTTSPSGNLHVEAANPRVRITNNSGTQQDLLLGVDSGVVWLGNEDNGPLYFVTNNTERMRIDASGNVGIGTSSPGARLDVKGAGNTAGTYSIKVANSDGTIGLQIREDGYVGSPMIYANTNANGANVVITADGYIYRSTSSLKYKKNVQDADFGLSELLNLRPVTYQGNSGSDTAQVFGGLIAEEVHDAGLTEFVQYADDGTPDALAYGHMVSLCVKAIQEQQAIIEDLKARVAALES